MAWRDRNRTSDRAVGLQQLLFACFVIVSIVPLSFLGLWVQRTAYQAELSAVEDKHLLLAKNLSGALSRYAMDLRAVFKEKSEAPNTVQSGEAHGLLAAFNLQAFACLEGESLVYKMGDATAFPEAGLDALAGEVAQARQLPQTVVFSPVVMNAEGEPTIYLLRVNSGDRLIIGSVSTEYFARVQKAVTFGDMGHAAIVDQTGQAIAHPRPDWQQSAKDMSGLLPVQRMMQREIDVAQFYSPALEADMIAGYAFVPETGWGVMIPQPISELKLDVRSSGWMALLVSLTGLLIAGGISWQLARYLIAPIQALVEASKQLSQGEVTESLSAGDGVVPRELKRLLEAFNQMASEVSLSRTTLQEKVAEQTRELREEVEERRRLEGKLIEMANHDELTGLPNRRCLVKQITLLLADTSLGEDSTLVLFIDLDGFKAVNDTFGHQTGDELLVMVTQRLQESLQAGDGLYRLGGDEFVVTLPGRGELGALALSEVLIRQIRQPFWLKGQSIQIGCSIGIREIHPGVEDLTVDRILSEADAAMYQAKVQRNCAVVFESVAVG